MGFGPISLVRSVNQDFRTCGFTRPLIGSKPHLSGFCLKVVMIGYSRGGYIFVHYCGVVKEPKSASRLDAFFVHSSVGVIQNRFRGNVDQTDYVPIVELNARAALEPKKPTANCDPLSNECLR